MATQNLASYQKWLKDNAFWNDDLVSITNSPIGGIGVFWKDPSTLSESLVDTVLLRVPKSNILSCKNSLIYNLLVDYNEIHGNENSEFDLTTGMHGLIISFIYELNMGASSPWYDYLKAIDPQVTEIDVPICLWSESERKLLQNTEAATLGMLDLHELVLLFEECIKFAKNSKQYATIPSILDIDLSKKDSDNSLFELYQKNLNIFGACVQTVISKAFQVDEFHGPSLVPGADLFNHLSPLLKDGEIIDRETVHFVCDGGLDVCGICGEQDCDHFDDEDDSEVLMNGMDDVDETGSGSENENEDKDEDEDLDIEDSEDDIEIESSDTESEPELESDEGDDQKEQSDEEQEEDDSEIGEITMELIEKLEQEEKENENDNSFDNDEEGEISEEDQEEQSYVDGEESKLHSTIFKEGMDSDFQNSSRCVDIVLVDLPKEQYNYEIFNTYGNELSNPYLLQRYGFVCDHKEPNINDSVLLFNQVIAFLKKTNDWNTEKKTKQLEMKLDWLENNFESLCEIIAEFKKYHQKQNGSEDEEDDDEDDDEDEDEDEEENEDEEEEFPETWQLAFKVDFDGNFSIHSYVILRLLYMPFKLFKYKLAMTKPTKLLSRVDKYLLSPDNKDPTEVDECLKEWCLKKLKAYPTSLEPTSSRTRIIKNVVEQEASILGRALDKTLGTHI